MSRVVKIESSDHLLSVIKQNGYVVIIITKPNDWPSEQFTNKCAEYSRLFPFIQFGYIDATIAQSLTGRVSIDYVPTTIFYRNGVLHTQIIGTDYATMEKNLAFTRRDGPSLVPPRQNTGREAHYSAPINAAIFSRHKKMGTFAPKK